MQDRYAIVDRLFEQASALPLAEREAFLDASCTNLPRDLRDEVELLLRAEQRLAKGHRPFLERSDDASDAPEEAAQQDSMIGQLVGPFQIQERVGSGGFGDVYAAFRAQEFEQQVAIKFVRRDHRDRKMILRRFELERQLLSDLNHPHIARLLDGGSTSDGRPYFVMELVRGQPITKYCDERKLPVKDRVRLMRDVCLAVAHAHQLGVIHRDVKPGNILVTSDGDPKLVDFGIAKVVGPERDRLVGAMTETKHLPMTPDYASPEQVHGDQVGMASDVYSLGIVLYELLTGVRPYDVGTSSQRELLRIVNNSTPDRPSDAVLRKVENETEAATKNRQSRKSCPSSKLISHQLRGDLDSIVLKALRKEPEHRYASAKEFADDIERYLGGQSVVAAKGTWRYHFGKFARRHRLAVLSAGIMTAVILAAAIGVLVAWRRSDQLAHNLAQNLYESEISRAYTAWNERDVRRTEQLLAALVPPSGERDLREFSWYYLASLYRQNEVITKPIPGQIFGRPTYDRRNHAYFCTRPEDPTGQEGESKPRYVVHRLDINTGQATIIAEFERELLAIGSQGDKFLLKPEETEEGEEPPTGLVLQELATGTSKVIAAPFEAHAGTISADGSLVAALSAGGDVCVWDASSLELLFNESTEARVDLTENPNLKLKISDENQWIAVIPNTQEAVMWEISSGQRRHVQENYVNDVCFNDRKGQCVVSGTMFHFFDLTTPGAPADVDMPIEMQTGQFIDYSPDGLLANLFMGALQVYDAKQGLVIAERNLPKLTTQFVGFDETGNRLVCIADHEFFVWDYRETEVSVYDGALFGFLDSVAAHGPPVRIGFGGDDGNLIVWSPETNEVQRIDYPKGETLPWINEVVFSNNGNLVAAGGSDGHVLVWDLLEQRQLHLFQHTSGIQALAFSADATKLVAGGPIGGRDVDPDQRTSCFAAWDIASGRQLFTASCSGATLGLAFAPGDLLVECGGTSSSGRIRVWNIAGPQPVVAKEWPRGHFFFSTIAQSPDGRKMAIVENRGTNRGEIVVSVYDLTEIDQAPRAIGSVFIINTSVEFSPDGRTIIDAGYGRQFNMYSVTTGRKIATLKAEYVTNSIEIVQADPNRIGVVLAKKLPADNEEHEAHAVWVHWIDKQAVDDYWRAKRLESP